MKTTVWHVLDQIARRLTPFLLAIGLVVLSQVPMQLPASVSLTPLLAIIAVYFWGLHNPDLMPAPAVFFIGLLQDILSGVPLGLNTFILLVVYGVVVSQRRFFYGKSFAVLWWGFATLCVFIGLFQWILLSILSGEFVPALATAIEYLASAAVYPLVAYIFVLTHRNLLRES